MGMVSADLPKGVRLNRRVLSGHLTYVQEKVVRLIFRSGKEAKIPVVQDERRWGNPTAIQGALNLAVV